MTCEVIVRTEVPLIDEAGERKPSLKSARKAYPN